MPVPRPRRLSPRGILSELLPSHFIKLPHVGVKAPTDVMAIKVPWDVSADAILHKKKLAKWERLLPQRYDAGRQPIKGTSWCATTGSWVPRHTLSGGHIFPYHLGSNLADRILGTGTALWSPALGLMLPRPVHDALKDWALVIVPYKEKGAQETANAKQNEDDEPESNLEYQFRMVDTDHDTMPRSEHNSQSKTTARQLDRKPLLFLSHSRPHHAALYFSTCCAMWKKTYLQDPECQDEEDFCARFLGNMEQSWGPKDTKSNLALITDIFLMKHRETPRDMVFFRGTLGPMFLPSEQRFRKSYSTKGAQKQAAPNSTYIPSTTNLDELEQFAAPTKAQRTPLRPRQVSWEGQRWAQVPSAKADLAHPATSTSGSDNDPAAATRTKPEKAPRTPKTSQKKEANAWLSRTEQVPAALEAGRAPGNWAANVQRMRLAGMLQADKR